MGRDTYTIQIDSDLLKQTLQLLQDREWATENAAENTYCQSCQTSEERYRDQAEHHEGCEFVNVTAKLKHLLEGDSQS